jgi:hypothetical protein
MVSVVPVSVGGNGKGTVMRTVSDNYFKVHRLSAELVLGAVGDTHVVDELRSAIAADVGAFPDMRDTVIPRHVLASREKHPHGCFSLLLMGVCGGKVCLAEWASGSPEPSVPVTPVRSIGTIAIGYSSAGVAKATDLAFDALIRRKRFLPAEQETHAALARICDDISKENPEINNRMRFESVNVQAVSDVSTNHKLISQGQTQVNLFEDPGNTEVVVFEATDRLTNFAGGEIWIGATGVSDHWGSCNVLVSADGTTYKQLGTINAQARLGTVDSTFASGTDPDTTNSLVVDLVENSAMLEAGTTGDADNGSTLCYVDGEIVGYSAAAISGPDQYTLNTYIRRGQMGSAIAAHAAASAFLRLDDTVFKFAYDPAWGGKTVYFKFQSVNTFGNAAQDASTLTPVTFAIPGLNRGVPPSQATAVINPNFEASSDLPPYGWIPGTVIGMAYETSAPYEGTRSLALAGTLGSSSTAITNAQKFLVRAGDSYQLSAALSLTAGGAGSNAQVRFAWRDASGASIAAGANDIVVSQSTIGGGFAVLTASGTAPSGAVSAVILLQLNPSAHATRGLWDSIKLTQMTDLSSDVVGTLPINSVGARTGALQYVIDGAGSVVTTGVKGQLSIPTGCVVTGWTITADQSGSAVVDVLRSTYASFPTVASIAGTDKPTLSSAQKNRNTGPLSGWGSTALNAGDELQFSVTSCTTCTRLIVTLTVLITG